MRPGSIVVMWVVVGLAGCGGGDSGVPLVSGSLTLEYKGETFTPTFGFATVYQATDIIGLGDGDIHCGSPEQNNPPPGTNAIISMSSGVGVGSYSNLLIQVFHNVDEFEGTGTNSGSVTITASSAETVTGTVAFSYTDDEGETYGLNGSFEILRCPVD